MKRVWGLFFLVLWLCGVPPADGGNYLNRAVVNPRVERNLPQAAPRVILVFMQEDLDLMCSLTNANGPVYDLWGCGYRFGSWRGQDITIAGPVMGAPFAVMALEKLIAQGGRMFLTFGWCGSLQSKVRIGHLVLPTAAMSGDGTTPYYRSGKINCKPDTELCSLLSTQIKSRAVKWHRGVIWSTDAIFRETVFDVLLHQFQGHLAVEMETAALCAAARYRGIPLASLLVVSDELFTLRWHRGFNTPEFKAARDLAAEIVLDTAAAWQEN
jgi:uridine phosphorylase